MHNDQANQNSDGIALMSSLRDEILKAEEAGADLHKWRLALAGAIGAAGLGFAGPTTVNGADLVLCVIPSVCVYVDFLCRQLKLRTLVIGRFLQTDEAASAVKVTRAYEVFADRARADRWWWNYGVYAFDDWALEGATILLSVFVLLFPILFSRTGGNEWLFYLSGALGIALETVGSWLQHCLWKTIRTETWHANLREARPLARN